MRRYSIASALLLVIAGLIGACDDDGGPTRETPSDDNYTHDVVVAFPNLEFARPVDIQNAGDGTNRLFVVEQRGVIRVFVNADTVATAPVFLDISSQVTSFNERGLLGLAFHPDYGTNGYFYVYYTPSTGGVSRVSRFQVSAANPDSADAQSETVLLEIRQQFANHNGGQLAFGPDDYLYIAVGDEGGAGDPNDNAQDLTTLHGSILRIDVDSQTLGNYGIPPDNPFAFNIKGYRPEIYAYGLRNPWRFSFDPVTGLLWAGDVGQESWEEIDIIERGGNFGWDCREGESEYDPSEQSAACDTVTRMIDPVWTYGRAAGHSVTGGHVYRGPTVTSLTGVYIYADYVSGRIWGLAYDGKSVVGNAELFQAGFSISSLGVDEAGELYLCEYDGTLPNPADQQIYKLRQTVATE